MKRAVVFRILAHPATVGVLASACAATLMAWEATFPGSQRGGNSLEFKPSDILQMASLATAVAFGAWLGQRPRRGPAGEGTGTAAGFMAFLAAKILALVVTATTSGSIAVSDEGWRVVAALPLAALLLLFEAWPWALLVAAGWVGGYALRWSRGRRGSAA